MNVYDMLHRYIWRGGLLLALVNAAAWAQKAPIIWQQSVGGSRYDHVQALIPTRSGGFAAVGDTYSTDGALKSNQGSADFFVSTFDASGLLLWQKTFGGAKADHARAIAATSDGGFVLVGFSESTDGQLKSHQGGADYWIVRLDADGEVRWQQSLGGSKDDFATAITPTPDGGFLVAGFSESQDGHVPINRGETDGWVVKLNGSGELVWQQIIGGKGAERVYAVTTASDGSFFLAGATTSIDGSFRENHGENDFWVAKLSSSGNLLWQQTLGGSRDDVATAITATEGGVLVAGYTLSNDGQVQGNHGQRDFWVVQLNESGELLWQQTLGGSRDDFATSVVNTPDQGFLISGYTYSSDGQVQENHGKADYWLVKLKGTGELVWQQTLGGSLEDRAYGVLANPDGSLIVGGASESRHGIRRDGKGREDGWLIKLKPQNMDQPAIQSAEVLPLWTAALLGNPVRDGQVNLEIQQATDQPLRLQIHNLQGLLITEQLVKPMSEKEKFTLNLGNQPAGILLLKINSLGRSQTLKILIAK